MEERTPVEVSCCVLECHREETPEYANESFMSATLPAAPTRVVPWWWGGGWGAVVIVVAFAFAAAFAFSEVGLLWIDQLQVGAVI